ncbi:Uncharacterized protein TPAR_07629 [Tolypocladium paradoxum]|uniref:Transcription activator GCR1-like domain-containing protein n=1 Tax=Tolypocladium paradoxum TaxID=94208 RepID=A0A2S4KPT0_9HYPO|nr:Uncharacterized protein TPAR_07629 [Tolypocladium paradoxum]
MQSNLDDNKDNTPETTTESTVEESDEATRLTDAVPIGWARVVANMRQRFAEELETVSAQAGQVTKELQGARNESAELRRRLDMQIEILKGVVDLITQDRHGPVGESVDLTLKQAAGTTTSTTISEASSDDHLDDDSSDTEYRHKTRQHPSGSVAGDMETDHDASESATARSQTMSPQTTGWTAANKSSEQGGTCLERCLGDGADSTSEFDSDWPGEVYDKDSPGHSSTPTPSPPTPSDAHFEQPIDIGTLPDLPAPSGTTRPRFSGPRRTTARYASGPPGRPLRYHRMGRSVASVWREWKHGAHGNPPAGALEARYGTGWRAGTLQERKYGSNWVAVRNIVVEYVEAICEDKGLTSKEAVR